MSRCVRVLCSDCPRAVSSRTKALLCPGLGQGPPKVWEMLQFPPWALGRAWWAQAHSGSGSSTAPKVLCSRGTIRNCGCSTGCFLKGNLQG